MSVSVVVICEEQAKAVQWFVSHIPTALALNRVLNYCSVGNKITLMTTLTLILVLCNQ